MKPTTGYWVQHLFGNHTGDVYHPCEIVFPFDCFNVKKRVACSVVTCSLTDRTIVKIVNMLPASVQAQIDIKGIKGNPSATLILSGNPDGEWIEPVEENIYHNGVASLRQYSLTVMVFDN